MCADDLIMDRKQHKHKGCIKLVVNNDKYGDINFRCCINNGSCCYSIYTKNPTPSHTEKNNHLNQSLNNQTPHIDKRHGHQNQPFSSWWPCVLQYEQVHHGIPCLEWGRSVNKGEIWRRLGGDEVSVPPHPPPFLFFHERVGDLVTWAVLILTSLAIIFVKVQG